MYDVYDDLYCSFCTFSICHRCCGCKCDDAVCTCWDDEEDSEEVE